MKKYERDDFLDDEGRFDFKKLEDGMTQEQKEITVLEEELKYMDTTDCFDESTEIAISCCQRISLSENSGAMSPQEVIEEKVLIDRILRWLERDLEKHNRHNRHYLVRYIQKKIDSIMEAKQTFGIDSFSKGSIPKPQEDPKTKPAEVKPSEKAKSKPTLPNDDQFASKWEISTMICGNEIPVTQKEKYNWEKHTTEEQRKDPKFNTMFGDTLVEKAKSK
jgi:hypothetical protein